MTHTLRFIFHATLVAALVLSGALGLSLRAQAATAGDLIACPDSDAVYLLGDDGRRHVFVNENVFFSWYPDFDDLHMISCENMAEIPFGELVLYQPGTDLVKIPSDPTVYAVEDDGRLRAITSEEQAEALYGEDWAERVDDIPETFFPHFEVEVELGEDEIPEGTILENEDGDLFRVDDLGLAQEVDSLLTDDLRAVLEEFILLLGDVEGELEIEIEIESEDEQDEETRIKIEIEFEPVEVEDEDEVEVEDIDEIDDEDEDAMDTEDEDENDDVDETEDENVQDEDDVDNVEDDESDAEDGTESTDDSESDDSDSGNDSDDNSGSGDGDSGDSGDDD